LFETKNCEATRRVNEASSRFFGHFPLQLRSSHFLLRDSFSAKMIPEGGGFQSKTQLAAQALVFLFLPFAQTSLARVKTKNPVIFDHWVLL